MNKIDEGSLIKLARDLIRIPSVTKGIDRGDEKEIADFLAKRMKEIGLKVSLQEATKGRPNVIGVLQGSGGGNTLMLNGHMDTVEAHGMKIDPFGGEVKRGRIYGRGASDMKGAIAAMITVCETIKEFDIELKGNLVISCCADEEGRGLGGERLAKSGVKADMAIVGEPTELKLGIANKGLTFIDIIAKGKAAHGSSPELGENAILYMNDVINILRNDYSRILNKKKHPVLGRPTFNIGYIEGGYRPNVVPDFCKISIDRRMIPGESYRSVMDEINQVIKKVRAKNPKIKIKAKGLNWIKCLPMEISAKEYVVKSVAKNLKYVTRKEPKIIGVPYWCDASSIVNIMKVPALIFGPGSLKQAHSSSEFIEINKLTTFAKTILLTTLDICNKDSIKTNPLKP